MIRKIGNIEQHTLLPYKLVNDENLNASKLFIKHDISYDFLKNSIYSLYNKLSSDRIYLKSNLLIVNNIKNNLGNLLINNFILYKPKKFSYINCNLNNCKICKFSLQFHFLKNNKFILPIQTNSNCKSIGIIYIILCIKCNKYYIGESKRTVTDRISEHIRNIKRFKRNIFDSLINMSSQSEIALHFNETGHNYINDFKFIIFHSNVTNDKYRKSIETDLIQMFKNFDCNILNCINKQPGLQNICYFTFQTEN